MLNFDFSPANPVYYLFILFAAVLLIQLIYYWGIFSRLAFYKKKNISDRFKPLSVIICAKNEYSNLKKNLHLILEQDYPDFEVVVVNDASEDETHYLLKEFSEKYAHLKVINFKKNVNFFIGKKFPLAIGIRSAKNEFLILTDADCYPSSNQWLRNIQRNYDNEKTQIVLAYSPYVLEPTLINYLIRFETLYTAIQYFSLALCGMPYMGVGRNLSYRRSLFIKNKGFSSHYHVCSGDDDIFINQVATKNNTCIEVDKEAQMFSFPKKSFVDWFKQKRRHYTTFPYYKKSTKFMLGLLSATNILFYVLFIVLMSLQYNIVIIASLFILRLATQLVIFKKCINKLSERKLLLFSPIFDILFTVLNPLIAFTNLVSRKRKWN